MPVIGIDLGTTYSCAMISQNGETRVIPSSTGRDLTPSVILFESDGRVLVGDDAKVLLGTNEEIVVGIKRYMGKEESFAVGGAVFTPEALSAIILRRIASDSASFLDCAPEELKAVITIPAYFGLAEQEATRAAARIAGIECLELLAEPVAAACAVLSEDSREVPLVVDVGGGTFDVALIEWWGENQKVWAVDGERRLGGLDWDRRVETLVWRRLFEAGIDSNAEADLEFVDQVSFKSEILKKRLSIHESATVSLKYNGVRRTVCISRAEFERASADLVRICVEAAERTVEESKKRGGPKPTKVFLVGGSTRMPMLRRAIERTFSLPVETVDPDRAVARGAALYAERIISHNSTVRIGNVLSRQLGVRIMSSAAPFSPIPIVLPIFPRGTRLPAQRAIVLATIQDRQPAIRVRIMEQNGIFPSQRLENNSIVFDAQITGIPPLDAGTPVDLLILLDSNGRVEMSAKMHDTGAPLKLEAFVNGVVDEREIEEQKSSVGGLALIG
nr:Hsp70 family protein [Schaalia cardiffensis]